MALRLAELLPLAASPSRKPGYRPALTPLRSSPVSPGSLLAFAHFSANIVRARERGISPSRAENFNYNRNYRLFPSPRF